MADINARLASALERLRRDIPDLRAAHPDDFWAVYQARADEISQEATQEEAPLVAKQLDDILVEHQLGPADPGA